MKGESEIMDVVVACKIVPDDQDVKATPDGLLDFSKARMTVSSYDKNAIEAATQIAGDGTVRAITAGCSDINESKVKKDILARGVDELYMAVSDSAASLDAFATANQLTALLGEMGTYDVIVVGDGSADLYAKQVGVQLAAALGLPYASAVIEATASEGKIIARRLLANEIESVEVPTPCVVAVTPDFADARVCGMKDILAAGKKPVHDIDVPEANNVTEEVAVFAPEPAVRKKQMFEDVAEFASALKSVVA